MNLELYKEELKKRTTLYQIYIGLALVFVALGNLVIKNKFEGESLAFDFATGLACGFELLLVFKLVKTHKAFNNEETLKKMYIKENDEREKTIRLKSGYPIIIMLSLAIFLSAILAGFFDKTVFFTLVIVGFVQILVVLILKIYWKNKL